ncbi:glycosyltransferase family 2 protein [Nanoarchaeota archaeon]
MRTELSVVVPCYNEEKNIPLIVKRFKEAKPKDIDAELVMVDNGSTDGSNALIKKLAKKHTYIKLAHVKKNIGYGFGVWTGLKKAKGEFICWTHADMQTDLKDTFKAYRLAKKQKDPKNCFVKGSRKGREFMDNFFTIGMSAFETAWLGTSLWEINAQPNLFHKTFLKNTPNPPKDFAFDLYFYYIAKKKGYDVVRFPVEFKQRIHGTSHWNTSLKAKWKFIKRTLDFSFKLKKKIKDEK